MDKRKLLFVDDRRKRIHSALRKYGEKYDVQIAPNVKEALRAISAESFDIISLDHDLNGDDFQNPDDRTCGMEIIRQIVDYGWPYHVSPLPVFIIHTNNAFAAQSMKCVLEYIDRVKVFLYPYSYDETQIEWESKL